MLSLKNGIDKEMLYKFVNLSGLSIHSIRRGGIRRVVDVRLAELCGQAEEEYYEEAEAGHGSKKEWRLVYVWISR